METAMQELIEAINKHYLNPLRTDIFDTDSFLEQEKEQIIEASRNSYIAGYLDNQCKVDESMNFPEEYYNQTYNQNK
jgi:hypothetical protein